MGSDLVVDPGSLVDPSKRRFLHAAGMLMAGMLVPGARADEKARKAAGSGHKVVVVVIGGVRRDETFSPEGMANIPHLSSDLLPQVALLSPCAQRRSDGTLQRHLQHSYRQLAAR